MSDNTPVYFIAIPEDIVKDSRISASAKLLYGVIDSFQRRSGVCYASNERLAQELGGCTARTASKCIGELKDAGYIQIDSDKARKIQLRAYVSDGQGGGRKLLPPEKKISTPLEENFIGGGRKFPPSNTDSSIDIEKENKKEKAKALTDEQLHALFVPWISGIAGEGWSRDEKNQLYFALVGFYEHRGEKKKEPARTKAAFTALSNRLVRYAGGSPANMVDMLERATTAGWKSVFPLPGTAAQPMKQSGGEEEIWLN